MPKGKKKKEKEPIDKFTEMEDEKLIEFINKTTQQIQEMKIKRNFVQQERDMITSFYEISKQEEQKLKEAIEKEEIAMDQLNKEHQNEINAFQNKYKHLEYDHEMFINDSLPKSSQEAVEREEEIRKNREEIYMEKKQDLKSGIKTNTKTHRDDIEKEKNFLKNNYEDKKKSLEQRLKDIIKKYKLKLKQLADDLELRLKVEIHELEERKNLHINNLDKVFQDKMNEWKNENINQIKESIKIIKDNIETLKDLENDNKKLQKENDILQKEIDILDAKYKEAKEINKNVLNRLAKYYNQEINMKNMKAKILSLREKCKETANKTEDIEKRKEETQEKIDDLKNKFRIVLDEYKEKTEQKNGILQHHIEQLNEDYEKKDYEIEEILKQFDQVANREGEEGRNAGFNREMVNDLMDHIKSTLCDKTIIIKRLKASLAVAAKAFNDTIRVYEAKLIEFGLPPEELGFQLLETNTSKMPAGLVAD
jgi:myosin heavy subunit